MDIPFALRFLKKVELFQIVKKLDQQFESHVEDFEGTVPLWEAEKKILHWTYKWHKHLGTPLEVKTLTSRKSKLIKMLKYKGGEKYEQAKRELISMDSNVFNEDGTVRKKLLGSFPPGYIQEWLKILEEYGGRIRVMRFTANEMEKLGVRKVFGNLVSRGYARFTPAFKSHEESKPSPENSSMYQMNTVYESEPTDQESAEGIIVTPEGLLVGELMNNLYAVERICSGCAGVKGRYAELTGANLFLGKKSLSWLRYNLVIWLSLGALVTLGWLVLENLYKILIRIVKNLVIPFVS